MADRDSRLVKSDDMSWIEQSAGSRYALLHRSETGSVTTITQFDAGAIGGWHTHPGGEELFVIRGSMRVGGHHLRTGDYLVTSPGARHRVEAIEETLVFVMLPEVPVYE